MFDDDEAAVEREKWRELRAALGLPEEAPTNYRPRLTEFGPTEAMLAGVVDRLGEVIAATIAAAGAKPPTIRPYPRPAGADDRLAGRRRIEKHEARVATWLV